MKKTVSIILCAAIAAGSAAACTPSAPAVSYEQRDVTAHTIDGETLTLSCLFREDLPEIPFLSAEDFFNQLFTEPVKVTGDGSGKYTVSDGAYTLELDAKNDTAFCECLEKFYLEKLYSETTKDYYPSAESKYIDLKNTSFDVTEPCRPFQVDFGKYQIDVAEKDGKVYLPFITFSDWFADSGCALKYKDNELSFKAGFDTLASGGGGAKLGDTRGKATAAFAYNELCFTMDVCYGKPSKALLAESIRDKGFDETLTSYNAVTKRVKELLLSERTEDYCKGMVLLQYYLADGGHTDMTSGLTTMLGKYGVGSAASVAKELFGDKEKEEIARMEAAQDKTSAQRAQINTIAAEQQSVFNNETEIKSWEKSRLFRKGDTFLFSFSGFDDSIPEALHWSLDYAAAQNAKNFIIDVSYNNGGLGTVVTYIMSVLCGEDSHSEPIAMTGNTARMKARVDKNLDEAFDQKDDAVNYDFRFGILCSQSSYSAANMLPCIAQDCGVAILGETSGGGSCNITAHYGSEGGLYALSGTLKDVHPDGSDFDSGAAPDIPMPGADKDYKGFYDIEAMAKGLEAFYGQ